MIDNLILTNPTFKVLELSVPNFDFDDDRLLDNKKIRPYEELLNSVRLGPNGTDRCEYSIIVVNQNGQPVPNIPVTFSVQPTYPVGWWRDMKQVKQLYKEMNSKNGWKGKRLIGTLDKSVVNSDAKGWATVTYTSSHIGGDDPNRCGEETIIAKLENGLSISGTILLGFTNLRLVNEIAGGLIFLPRVKARYADPGLANFLERLGRTIKDSNWPKPLVLNDISNRWGGMIPPHAGHIYGVEIDCRPMSTDGNGTKAGKKTCPKAKKASRNYDRIRNKIVAKMFKDSGCTKFFFNDSEITESTCYPLHHNHMHLSWLPQALYLLQDNQEDDFEYKEF